MTDFFTANLWDRLSNHGENLDDYRKAVDGAMWQQNDNDKSLSRGMGRSCDSTTRHESNLETTIVLFDCN